jgi:limonene-1,2-epoxide hydrolase
MTTEKNVDLTREFLASLSAKDIDAVIDAFATEIFYHNLPLEPLNGKDEVRAFWEPFAANIRSYRIEHKELEGRGNRVYSERMEYFDMEPDGTHIELPVAGVFEFNDDGKIVNWREYWDASTWTSQGGAAFE